jgi:hypothetical protein
MSPLSCPLRQQLPGDRPVDAGFQCDKTAMLRGTINGALSIFKIKKTLITKNTCLAESFLNRILLINVIFTDNVRTLSACDALSRSILSASYLEPQTAGSDT